MAGSSRTRQTGDTAKMVPESTSRAAARKQRRRRRLNERRNAGEAEGIIDLTNDNDDDGDGDIEALETASPSFFDGLKDDQAGPSRKANGPGAQGRSLLDRLDQREEMESGTSVRRKGKGKAVDSSTPNDTAQGVEGNEGGSTAATSFKPLARSIMAGWQLSPSRSPSPHREASASPMQADIFIDEKPADNADRGQSPGSAKGDEPTGHFDPPGLFSTALIPSKRTKRTLRKEEKKREAADERETDQDGEGVKTPEEALLLPAHVVVNGSGEEPEGREMHAQEEGLHILDDSQAKGVTRYFDPQVGEDDTSTFLATADQSRICMNCKRPGHNQRDCPHIICPTCGKEDEHERRDCPYNLICFRCGLAGHKIQDCSKPRTKGGACDKCGAHDHTAVVCPSLWRMYSYFTQDERNAVKREVAAYTGWAKEAAGGDEGDRCCYNCARRDHYGDDCPRSRGSLARFAPSAFSKLTLSLGPFSTSYLASLPPKPTHQRWDDDEHNTSFDSDRLPGQVTPFAGLNAGKKTIEKRKRAAMEQERQFGGSEPRRRRKDGKDAMMGSNGLPFGHRQFMSPSGSPAVRNDQRQSRARGGEGSPQQIQFGKLSMPGASVNSSGRSTPKNQNHAPGPSGSASASTTLVNRALRQSFVNSPSQTRRSGSPLASTSTPTGSRKRDRKRKSTGNEMEEGEIEELEFRRSGHGGGPVSEWGKEMDEEERKARKVAAAERKRAKEGTAAGAGGASGGGLSIKGRSKPGGNGSVAGQKYHGGY